MQKLDKNHPRFCAQYVRYLGQTSVHRINGVKYCELHGRYYATVDVHDLQVGDIMVVVKKVKLPGNVWHLHEAIVPECYWTYENYQKLTPKEQRQQAYVPCPNIGGSLGNDLRMREVSAHFLKQRAFKR